MPKKKTPKKKKRKLLPNVFNRFAIIAAIIALITGFYLSVPKDKVMVLGESTVSEEIVKKELESVNFEKSEFDSTQVDCVGPDEKHFVVTFSECREFNKKWGNYDFKYTVLKTEEKNDISEEKLRQKELEKKEYEELMQKRKLEKETEKKNLNINKVEVQKIEKKDVLMKNHDLMVGVSSHNQTSSVVIKTSENLTEKKVEELPPTPVKTKIKSGNVEAETEFEVKVLDNSNNLKVITKSGEHDVNILPSHAVANLITLDVLTSVQSKADEETATSEAESTIQLTELENELVFEVDGVLEKKLLGIIPVAFTKKVYVSVDNGKIIKTDEAITNKFLNVISF